MSRSKTFGLHSAKDLLAKLGREIIALRNLEEVGDDRLAICDAALNGCQTAWHLTDWSFKELSPEQHLQILAFLVDDARLDPGAKGPPAGLPTFQEHLQSLVRSLHLCREVALHAKHVTMTRIPPDPGIGANVTGAVFEYPIVISPDGEVLTTEDGETLTASVEKAWAKIGDGPKDRLAVSVLEECYDFWRSFLADPVLTVTGLSAPRKRLSI